VTEFPIVPLVLRTRLAHAALQSIADDCGADILHIKGSALDASLLPVREGAPAHASPKERTVPRVSADADILVRPMHLGRLLTKLPKFGWQGKARFDTGGGADHAAPFWHSELGWADVHRSFPGIRLDPELAFERLWLDRRLLSIAHHACPVPSIDGQRTVLLLHAARNGESQGVDVRAAWTNATVAERDRIMNLATQLQAEVALAGALGRLDEFVDRPEHDLWRLFAADNPGRFDIWRARMKAAQSAKERLHVLINPLRLKVDGLSGELGRKPTVPEILRFYGGRLWRDAVEIKAISDRRTCRRQRILSRRGR